MELQLHEAILRLLLAVILGSVVGIERELGRQSAGLRTHILVCLGAAAFTLVSISDMSRGLMPLSGFSLDNIHITHDPARVAAQVVTGIGFIGGGAVLRHGSSIRGLTTAASLWMMASVGMLCGVGHYYLAGITTLLSFLVLFIIGWVERSFLRKKQRQFNRMRVQINTVSESQDNIHQWFERKFGTAVTESESSKDLKKLIVTLVYMINLDDKTVDVNRLSRQIDGLPGVTSSSVRLYQDEAET